MAGTKPKTSLKMLPGVFTSLSIVTRILWVALIILIIFFFVPYIVPYIDNATSFSYIRFALTIEEMTERSLGSLVRQSLPTTVAGTDITRWIVVVGIFMLSMLTTWIGNLFRDRAAYFRFQRSVDEWKSRMNLSDNAAVLSPLNQKLRQMRVVKKHDREELLKIFAETKKELAGMGRDLAFLSIDVVNSTGMKEGEEAASIEFDFNEYRRLVERIIASHGALKSAWTPDGVMICFSSVDAAVGAAKDLILNLEDFNKNVKLMRSDFMVRCGVNSGFVYFDDTVPLEQVSDRVIDIAGHMQKYASPNTVFIAKPAVEPLHERTGFESTEKVVDGYQVYEWKHS
jgi:class 3 adenylate cyclase